MGPQDEGDRALEAAFVARLVAREEAAFNELVQLYGDRVFGLVYRMLGSRQEAEEIVQDVFVQVFKAIDQFRLESKLSTWLFRVAVNLSRNRLKYHARRQSAAHRELDTVCDRSGAPGAAGTAGVGAGTGAGGMHRPDEWLEGVEAERAVQQALAQLDPEFRQLVVLRDLEDLSYEEIALLAALPLGTVKSRIHRGRAQLRAIVEQLLGQKLGGGDDSG
ncbi:MAG: sigma-70 family RNA polymerase sigma factor [Deltaproteobacteria bacterium]|nr:sigma-70 family RNA polymerase sigma factor [Deltaproteobacteria bacterium]